MPKVAKKKLAARAVVDRAQKYTLPEGIQIHDLKIPPAQFSSELPAIEFYPNGGSNGGSFLLERENQKGYRIKVNFLTGMVEIKAG